MTPDASRATTGAGRSTKPVRGLVIAGGSGALPCSLNLAVRHPLPLLLGLLTPPPDPLSLHLFPFVQVIGFSRPWLCYWMVHPLALLDEALDDDLENDIIDFLARCQDKDGGYSGGPGQVAPISKPFEPHTFEHNIFDFAICIDFFR